MASPRTSTWLDEAVLGLIPPSHRRRQGSIHGISVKAAPPSPLRLISNVYQACCSRCSCINEDETLNVESYRRRISFVIEWRPPELELFSQSPRSTSAPITQPVQTEHPTVSLEWSRTFRRRHRAPSRLQSETDFTAGDQYLLRES